MTAAAASLPLAVVLAALVAAQQRPAFHVETRLRMLYVSVSDAHGDAVTTLNRDDFTIAEDGRPQAIQVFSREDVPVSLGLLIDDSGSMRALRAPVEAAALALARASNPRDELFVINFADRSRLDVPFTSDLAALERGIAAVDAIGGTALRDAVTAATAYLAHASRDRRVVVVITDGRDNTSLSTLDEVRAALSAGGVALYGIALNGARSTRRDLDDLAEHTGGVVHAAASIAEVERLALDIARQIRQQYTLAYAVGKDDTPDGNRIRVTVRGRKSLLVRVTPGHP